MPSQTGERVNEEEQNPFATPHSACEIQISLLCRSSSTIVSPSIPPLELPQHHPLSLCPPLPNLSPPVLIPTPLNSRPLLTLLPNPMRHRLVRLKHFLHPLLSTHHDRTSPMPHIANARMRCCLSQFPFLLFFFAFCSVRLVPLKMSPSAVTLRHLHG